MTNEMPVRPPASPDEVSVELKQVSYFHLKVITYTEYFQTHLQVYIIDYLIRWTVDYQSQIFKLVPFLNYLVY